jgi:hypothetical protein
VYVGKGDPKPIAWRGASELLSLATAIIVGL